MQFTATETDLRTQQKKPVAASDVHELMAAPADKRD